MVMDWPEIKRRLKNGTSVQILADLNGVTYKTMYNRIKQHETKDGCVYMSQEQKNKRTHRRHKAPAPIVDPFDYVGGIVVKKEAADGGLKITVEKPLPKEIVNYMVGQADEWNVKMMEAKKMKEGWIRVLENCGIDIPESLR